jgi:integrase
VKIEKILDIYMAEHGEHICSVLRTRSSVKNLKARFGCFDHSKLTPAKLRNYRSGEGLEPATVNRDLGVLRAALKYLAEEKEEIRSVPEIKNRRGAGKRITWLPPEQIKTLIAEAQRYQGLLAFILLALMTGQRKEALLSLRWAQIRNGVVWFSDHNDPRAERMKGRGDVPVSPELAELLEKLPATSSPYVLNSKYGDRYTDINWDQWREVTKAAGLEGLRPHDLRHTVATNLIREGVSLLDVSKMLGHANTRITEAIYVSHEPKFLTAAAGVMGGLTRGVKAA